MGIRTNKQKYGDAGRRRDTLGKVSNFYKWLETFIKIPQENVSLNDDQNCTEQIEN
jgi:hypothetical protein